MLKPLIRTLNGWRFDLPLAVVLGAAVAFEMIAMPYTPLASIPVVAAHGLGRVVHLLSAIVAAPLAGLIAYRALRFPWSGKAAPAPVAEPVEEAVSPADGGLRLRRSDAHPDFPPREPIIASRDLGEPFMDIIGFDDGSDAFVGGAGPRILDGDYVELPATEPEPIAEPVAVADPETVVPEPEATPAEAAVHIVAEDAPVVATEMVPDEPLPARAPVESAKPVSPLTLVEDSEEHPSIAAFTPESEIEPAPQPERARRESLNDMMDRLSAGLERRAGRPVSPPPAEMLAGMLARPRAATPELRDALNELNRLAGRRG